MSSANPPPAESAATTSDGVPYRIRPIRRDDATRELAFISGLSPETRYNRLMYSMREPSAQFLRQLVEVDYRDTMALLATVPGAAGDETIIGVARYAADAPGAGTAEFAVTVADAWQGRGIGTTLTRALFAYARERGLSAMRGTILAANTRMIELARELGMVVQPDHGDPSLVAATRALR
jgi:acetyltransferase